MQQALDALENGMPWLHRRVERVSITLQLMIKRQVSVDFTIPPANDGEPQPESDAHLLPISLLAKWPPQMQFDLRDAAGDSVYLLTAVDNEEADARALTALAPDGALKQRAQADLELVPRSSRDLADAAVERIQAEFTKEFIDAPETAGPARDEYDRWVYTLRIARLLTANRILWAPVTGKPGERKIVKFSLEYAESGFTPRNETNGGFRRAVLRAQSALSLAPTRFEIKLLPWGDTVSHHLEVDLPAELEAQRTRLELTRSQDGHTETQAALDETTGRFRHTFPHPGNRDTRFPYARNDGERAYFHYAGIRRRFGSATLDTAIANRVLLAGPAALGLAIATLLTVYTASVETVTASSEEVVTTLLLVPAILGYLVSRPGEHPMVRQHIGGIRLLTMLAGALPVVAAVTMVAVGSESPARLASWWMAPTIVAWIVAAILMSAWLTSAVSARRMMQSEPHVQVDLQPHVEIHEDEAKIDVTLEVVDDYIAAAH